MDKQTLSNYGWVIITVLVLAVMIALATPFGSYIKEGAKSTLTGLFESSENALNTGLSEAGVTLNKAEFGGVPTVGDNDSSASADNLNHSGIIPEGGRYVTNALLDSGATPRYGYQYDYTNSTTLTAGSPFPKTPQSGDIYYYGNYAYIFNGGMGYSYESYDEYQAEYDDIDGWCVTARMYDGVNPGEILSSITGKNVKSLRYCFYGCGSLEVLPQIPVTVTDISCFLSSSGSSNLRTYAGSTDPDGDFSNYKIPNSVTNIESAFCYMSLTTAPTIPNSVTNMSHAFVGCTSLTAVPIIPNSVTDMNMVFYGCTSLVIAPEIPNSVTNMSYTFYGCTSLKTAPIIPNSVTLMGATFSGCASLTTAPTIPNSVTDMSYTFYGTPLIVAPEIPNGVTNMNRTFFGCTNLTTAPIIPSGVTDMAYTFYGCKSLTGTITINANPTNYTSCFKLYSTTGQPITLTGSSTMLQELANTSSNRTITIQ